MSRISIAFCALLFLIGPVNAFSYKRTLSLMTYNLENLFDTLHDEGKEDYTFLPLVRKERDPKIKAFCYNIPNPHYRNECLSLDWSAPVLLNKIRNISQIIRDSNNGAGPDFLVLQEVENYNVLQKLINLGLIDEGYEELVIVEGPDKRGIDVAIVSRFPLKKDIKYHDIDLSILNPSLAPEAVKKTRGVLEATFSVNGKLLTIFANHWPSQGNPNQTRFVAARVLMNAIKGHPNAFVAAGDFNTEKNDRQNAIKDILTSDTSSEQLLDFEQEYVKGGESDLSSKAKGTHFYRGKWNSLDKVFISKRHSTDCRGKNCLIPYWDSFEIIYEPEMLEEISYESNGEIIFEKIPKRFKPETGLGASDHLPVLVRFSL